MLINSLFRKQNKSVFFIVSHLALSSSRCNVIYLQIDTQSRCVLCKATEVSFKYHLPSSVATKCDACPEKATGCYGAEVYLSVSIFYDVSLASKLLIVLLPIYVTHACKYFKYTANVNIIVIV